MKPFNLEKALAGKKVICRDPNFEVLSIKYHEVEGLDYPVSVIMSHKENGGLHVKMYSKKGMSAISSTPTDLFMAPETVTCWINVCRLGGEVVFHVFETKEKAENVGYLLTTDEAVKIAHKMEIEL